MSEKDREIREGWKDKRGVEREKLISKIYGIWTVGFRRRKRQSRSTHQDLRVGTRILELRQTPRGREFSYLVYFYPKGHLMGLGFS